MRVLVIGSGGREHAIAWKIAQSPRLKKLFCLPGNGGTARTAENVAGVAAEDPKAAADWAEREKIDLTVIGPEAPLAAGVADEFRRRGLAVFGPSQAASRIESSKAFAKEVMTRAGVPTAGAGVFDDIAAANAYLDQCRAPVVVKADGLAAGKGVVIAATLDEARECVKDFIGNRRFGQAGSRVVIEEFLDGEEASCFALCDGEDFVWFGSSQDHKRAFDADTGPNTGGMGAYSPAVLLGAGDEEEIRRKVFAPTLRTMKEMGCAYEGFLYAGLMMTPSGPKVLEFNARMGDPESQAVFIRLKNDLIDVIESVIAKKTRNLKLEWDARPAVTVVMASGGYPGDFKKGFEITGIDEAEKVPGVVVFHAGTKAEGGKILTSGGRVLAVSAVGDDITTAVRAAYDAVGRIRFENRHYRKDIAYRAIKYLKRP